MTTLRRELTKMIKVFFDGYLRTSQNWVGEELANEVAEILADEILSLRAFKATDEEQPEYSTDDVLSKAGIEWSILAGEKVEQEQIDRNVLVQEAKSAFERDMKFGTLPWGSDKNWERLEELVVVQYSYDKSIFAKYKAWQQGDGKYTSVSNRKIRENPAIFVDCFPDFLASMLIAQPRRASIQTDSNGNIVSY